MERLEDWKNSLEEGLSFADNRVAFLQEVLDEIKEERIGLTNYGERLENGERYEYVKQMIEQEQNQRRSEERKSDDSIIINIKFNF